MFWSVESGLVFSACSHLEEDLQWGETPTSRVQAGAAVQHPESLLGRRIADQSHRLVVAQAVRQAE